MPGYIKNVLLKYQQSKSLKKHHSPYPYQRIVYGQKIQQPTPEDNTPPLNKNDKKICTTSHWSIVVLCENNILYNAGGIEQISTYASKPNAIDIETNTPYIEILCYESKRNNPI